MTGEEYDWRHDAREGHDLALAALRARRVGLAVRHGHKGAPIEAIVHDQTGQIMVVELQPLHALTIARQLVEYAARELGE